MSCPGPTYEWLAALALTSVFQKSHESKVKNMFRNDDEEGDVTVVQVITNSGV